MEDESQRLQELRKAIKDLTSQIIRDWRVESKERKRIHNEQFDEDHKEIETK